MVDSCRELGKRAETADDYAAFLESRARDMLKEGEKLHDEISLFNFVDQGRAMDLFNRANALYRQANQFRELAREFRKDEKICTDAKLVHYPINFQCMSSRGLTAGSPEFHGIPAFAGMTDWWKLTG